MVGRLASAAPMSFLGVVLLTLLGWALIAWRVDRVSVPAYRARNIYRTLSLILALLLALLAVKALRWHDELVFMIGQSLR